MTREGQTYVIHSFCCFLCSWILFPSLHFNNNCSISFFIIFSARDSLLLMINSISRFKFSLTFGKSKLNLNVLASLITSRKLWFYCTDTKDVAFFLYNFLICMNCFYPSQTSIICLELKFFILYLLLLLLHHLLKMALIVNLPIFWPQTSIIYIKN